MIKPAMENLKPSSCFSHPQYSLSSSQCFFSIREKGYHGYYIHTQMEWSYGVASSFLLELSFTSDSHYGPDRLNSITAIQPQNKCLPITEDSYTDDQLTR